MDIRRSWSWIAALALFGTPMGAAFAEQSAVAELEAAADAVYLGEILLSRGARGDDGILRTHVVLEVQDPLKGSALAGERVTFTTPGGQVEGEVATVPGSPSFLPSEQVLLFLRRGSGGDLEILGLYEGRFALHPNPRTGEPMVIGFEPEGQGLKATSVRPLDGLLRELRL